MKIREIRSIPLMGRTPQGGWDHDVDPEENLHTLVEVLTDEGVTGVGSVFTSKALVEGGRQAAAAAAASASAPTSRRASPRSCGRSTFWQGRGGAVEHAISGIDIALWDLFGKVSNQPVARLLGGNYRDRIKPYGSILFDEPAALRDKLQADGRARLQGDQARLAAVRPARRARPTSC